MYQYELHQKINQILPSIDIHQNDSDLRFYSRFVANAHTIQSLYNSLYGSHPNALVHFDQLIQAIADAHLGRADMHRERDFQKQESGTWFLSNQIAGMSLYVDRFCGNLKTLGTRLDYFEELGVNFLHLMPLFESPAGESDGGYAVSDFRKIDARFGNLNDLKKLQQQMLGKEMYLMTDIVLNHTSHQHEWAIKARAGDPKYQDYYYMYNDRYIPDQFEQTMPEIFPETAPGNFTYIPECEKFVMTVFHRYQWDLNFSNPAVLIEMLNNIFFYANLGVDVLRIDAPAFIWKQIGTTCQNLPQAHTLLQLIKHCVQIAAPGMALLGEAIVAPKDIMVYFGTGNYTARECDFAYNATHMALQWDAIATGDTRVMLAAQHELLKKPYGTSWITYTRCHDDIGLGYDDYMIQQAGFQPYEHRKFLKDYFAGNLPDSPARGALFSVNPKTQDARISGTLASLCGLESALFNPDDFKIDQAIRKIVLMQAHSFFLGGVPMLFYGDEVGYTNDYGYLQDDSKSYDNRWMHRPMIDWEKNNQRKNAGTVEERIFSATQRLIALRRSLPVLADCSNLTWLSPYNIHVAGFIRQLNNQQLFCFFNFKNETAYVNWMAVREKGNVPNRFFDHWRQAEIEVGFNDHFLIIEPYGFCILEPLP